MASIRSFASTRAGTSTRLRTTRVIRTFCPAALPPWTARTYSRVTVSITGVAGYQHECVLRSCAFTRHDLPPPRRRLHLQCAGRDAARDLLLELRRLLLGPGGALHVVVSAHVWRRKSTRVCHVDPIPLSPAPPAGRRTPSTVCRRCFRWGATTAARRARLQR